MLDLEGATERVEAVFDRAPTSPDWSCVPGMARLLLEVQAETLEYAATHGHCDDTARWLRESIRTRTELKKIEAPHAK
jgi:hypothetical protein